MQTEGFMSFETEQMQSGDIQISSSNDYSSASKGDFKEQSMSGLGTAAKGAAIGYVAAGPIGAVVGAIGGFLLGIGTYEGEEVVQQQRTTYTLDVTEIKANLRKFYIEKANEMQQQFEEQMSKNIFSINESIKHNIDAFITAVNEYLDGLEKEFNEKKDEREAYISYLSQLSKAVEAIQKEILK